MSICRNCISEKVCKYNDGVNLYCKDEYKCPHFRNKTKIVDLPFKVGEKVWVNDNWDIGENRTHPRQIEEIFFDCYGNWIRLKYECRIRNFNEIGKTRFCSKEEAEKTLK
jgi:hypothetical protein